jgi:uncharacterized protein (DUF305 family)
VAAVVVGSSLLTAVAAAQKASLQSSGDSTLFSATAAGPNADAAFVQAMLLYAQQGIDLLTIAEDRSSRDELRAFAERALTERRDDIHELQRMQRVVHRPLGTWTENDEEVEDPDSRMMMQRLRVVPAAQFDAAFLPVLIAQYDIAIGVSKDTTRFQFPEVRAFATRFAARQQRERKELLLIQRGTS